MAKENIWDLSDKPQTKIKLTILKDYLSAWAKIFANQSWCDQIYYVDCFAGPGKYNDSNRKEIIDGSPAVALKIAQLFKQKYNKEMHCIFVEKDPKIFKDLLSLAEPFKNKGIKFKCINNDFNDVVDEVLNQVPNKVPVFFFVDPSGIDVKRETIEKMLNRTNIKEFLINYIQKGVERCFAFGKKCDMDLPIDMHHRALANLKRVQDFFGEDWCHLTKDQQKNLKIFLNVFVKHNEKVELKNQLQAKVIDIFYNQNRSKYYLIFLSRNKNAKKIIEDIFRKMKFGGTLFEHLPNEEKKRMYQGAFDL